MKIEIKNKLPEPQWRCLGCGETHTGSDGCPTCPPAKTEAETLIGRLENASLFVDGDDCLGSFLCDDLIEYLKKTDE